MHPIHDVDALLLLATALSAKRRPAEPVEIMAAIDLINGNIPAEAKLAEAIARLAVHGLLCGSADGLALTPAAQDIIEKLPRKAENEERLFSIRDQLSMHNAKVESPAIDISVDALRAALLAHRAAAASTAKNLLVPKPKPEDKSQSRPGQRQRKPMPARKRKG
nr:hypothetical protein [Dechloromonas sp.]